MTRSWNILMTRILEHYDDKGYFLTPIPNTVNGEIRHILLKVRNKIRMLILIPAIQHLLEVPAK